MQNGAAQDSGDGGLDAGLLSVVIPALNEAGNIGNLVRETSACIPHGILREIIVVDDGSDDATSAEVMALQGAIPQLRLVCHARRAGQSAALRTGVRVATAPFVATMDGDGQNDPHDIPPLLALITRSYDPPLALVGGIRQQRRTTLSKRIASRLANRLRATLLADGCPDTGCGLKIFRRAVFLDLPYFSGQHRYLPALVRAYGHAAAYMPVNDRPRRAGLSKYTNAGRALLGIHDLIGVSWLIRRTALPHVATAGRRTEPALSRPPTTEDRPCLQN